MGLSNMRTCRQHVAVCKSLVEYLLVTLRRTLNTRFKRICFLAVVVSLTLWLSLDRGIHKVGRYVPWTHKSESKPHSPTKPFLHLQDENVFIYSAIANHQFPVRGSINIVVTTLDGSSSPLECCVILNNATLFTTPAQKYFFYHTIDVTFIAFIMEYFQPTIYKARQYSCIVPEIGLHASHLSLTSSSCPSELSAYVPILYPPRVPGGLAICGKIAHSGGLDPEKVIEWFELQRILGVDKVLIYNLGSPESLNRVFRYYQEIGILDLQPYALPGAPANRTLMEKDKRTSQFHHDESMAVLECHQRMSGYSFLLSHDLDEYFIPRRNIGLKQFLSEQMKVYQDSAGFYLDTEFFIYNWAASHPKEDLALWRYRKATQPHRECTKFVYLPHRALSITTHSIFPLSPYTTYTLPRDQAILHHYRRCPDDVWSTCFPATIVDSIMARYHMLPNRVYQVRKATNIRPTWNSVSDER